MPRLTQNDHCLKITAATGSLTLIDEGRCVWVVNPRRRHTQDGNCGIALTASEVRTVIEWLSARK